jgi:hypothetical protein
LNGSSSRHNRKYVEVMNRFDSRRNNLAKVGIASFHTGTIAFLFAIIAGVAPAIARAAAT